MKIIGLFSTLLFILTVSAGEVFLKGVRNNGSLCSVKIDLEGREMGPVPGVEFSSETNFYHGQKNFSFSARSVENQAGGIILKGFEWQYDLSVLLTRNDQNKIISAVLTDKRFLVPGEKTLIVCKDLN